MLPAVLLLALVTQAAPAPPPPVLPAGQVVPDVRCAASPSQGYALYVPSAYTPARAWPTIIAFDPGGRGINPVERYQAAAEKYGYIVVGSNNSRNGAPDNPSIVSTLAADVLSRFHVDQKRVYTAGMSGGARVAFAVAMASPTVAGVFASSAGYPDSLPRKTLAFPVFATAGTEDFNHLELRILDRSLQTPHRLRVFEGGHVWLSSDVAMEAVAWMELQAMKRGLVPRETGRLDAIFATRLAALDAAAPGQASYLALQAFVEDFDGLKDVSAQAARVAVLAKDKKIRAAIEKDRDEDDREERILSQVLLLERRLTLTVDDDRLTVLNELRRTWKDLSERASKADDSPDRRLARRVLANLTASATTTDRDYMAIIAQYRRGPAAEGRGQAPPSALPR